MKLLKQPESAQYPRGFISKTCQDLKIIPVESTNLIVIDGDDPKHAFVHQQGCHHLAKGMVTQGPITGFDGDIGN